MKQHAINKSDNFIGGWYLSDTSICDELMDLNRTSPHTAEGMVGSRGTKFVDHNSKHSLDLSFMYVSDSLAQKYLMDNLQLVVKKYIKKYSYCNKYAPWSIIDPPSIQYYPPGGGYKKWHTERGNNTEPNCSRHLVFMTYLNDVSDAGETEFYHQRVKVKPEKGLTLIWPADWTFTHRGIPSPTQEKFIVTGWYNYIE